MTGASTEPSPFGLGRLLLPGQVMGQILPASTEPSPFGLGRFHHYGRTTSQDSCFNGAKSFRAWKGACLRGGHAGFESFNGAKSFRAWKEFHLASKASESAKLQRSQVLSGLEGCKITGSHEVLFAGFNGAKSFRAWKGVDPHVVLAAAQHASTEPSPFGLGRCHIWNLGGTGFPKTVCERGGKIKWQKAGEKEKGRRALI